MNRDGLVVCDEEMKYVVQSIPHFILTFYMDATLNVTLVDEACLSTFFKGNVCFRNSKGSSFV